MAAHCFILAGLPRPVDHETIEAILTAATRAPFGTSKIEQG